MKTTTKPSLNGINWMLQDTWSIAQAAQRLSSQCPVTTKVQCLEQPEPDIDPVRHAWDQQHGVFPESTAETKNDEEQAPKPVPSFSDIVRQQEHALAA